MRKKALHFKERKLNVIVDFICPTNKTREIFNADFIVWMDTIKKGRFDDTNKLFEKPNYYDVRVTEKNSELWAAKIFEKLKDEKK